MNQRKLITVVAFILLGLLIGTRIKMVRIGLIIGLVLGILGGSLLNSKNNTEN